MAKKTATAPGSPDFLAGLAHQAKAFVAFGISEQQQVAIIQKAFNDRLKAKARGILQQLAATELVMPQLDEVVAEIVHELVTS